MQRRAKVDGQEVGCKEEEEAERERKLTIRPAEGTGDEWIRRGNTESKEEVERERHERREGRRKFSQRW